MTSRAESDATDVRQTFGHRVSCDIGRSAEVRHASVAALSRAFARRASAWLRGIALVSWLVGGVVMADSGPSVEAINKRVVADRFAAWAAGTGGPFDLLADDATWTIVGRSKVARTYRSREDFMSGVIRPFNARMRERLVPTVRSLYAEGDTVIVFFDATAVTRDGARYANTYAWFLRMREGRIVSAHAFFDSIAFDELWERDPREEVQGR